MSVFVPDKLPSVEEVAHYWIVWHRQCLRIWNRGAPKSAASLTQLCNVAKWPFTTGLWDSRSAPGPAKVR